MQSLPVNGIVMVTTPQGLASMIVRKAVHMAQAVKTPIVGVVENMAYFICPDTGKKHFIFGPGHAEEVAQASSAPLLAQLPIDPQVAALCDAGKVERVHLDEIPALLDTFLTAPNMSVSRQPARSHTFSEKALQLIKHRENWGTMENPDAVGMVRGACGDSMQIDLRLTGKVIREALFTTDGCGATIACGSMLTKLVQAKTLSEAKQITPQVLLTALEGIPADHEHCAELAVQTLRDALISVEDESGIVKTP